MKIEDKLHTYYRNMINKVETPPCPEELKKAVRRPFSETPPFRIALAAALSLAFIPLAQRAEKPSALAVKAAEFSRYHNIESRITGGITSLHNIISPSIRGEKK